jgi:penicillin-binding protein 1A
MLVLLVWLGAFGRLPEEAELKDVNQSNASLVFSSDGTLMGKYYRVNRQSITNEAISPYVRQALIATEDNRFFEHHGVDVISLARVFVKSMLLGDRDQGGGSTISQQLAKNLYGRNDHGFISLPVNKLREMFIAKRLEEVYSKEEILNMYLNTVSFGENVYGIEAAARRFFSKPSANLSIPESATLIGMLAANTLYNPRMNPEKALKRRNTVLMRMHTQGFISEDQAEQFSREPVRLKYELMDANSGIAPYFRQHIRQEILQILGDRYDLESGGLRIYTTIDAGLQSYADAAIALHMKSLQQEFDRHWKGREPWEGQPGTFEQVLRNSGVYQKYAAKGLSHRQTLDSLSVPHKRQILTPGGEQVMEISSIDSLKHYLKMLNTGFVAMDAKTGAILAWSGGISFQYLPYDHVLSKRQAGSTFKPFVYAAALLNGMEPCSFFLNEQRTYEEFDNWSPGNSGGNYGGYYSMKGGLMNSVNTVTAEIMASTGPAAVATLARDMGIASSLPGVASLALGTAEVSLLEMVTAYSGFANQGVSVKPYGIVRIEDSEGRLVYQAGETYEYPGAFDQQTGLLMSSMLQAVVDSGTARSARTVYGLQSALAGKTGTTQDNADGWFIGYTPGLVVGAWVGAEMPAVHFRTTALGSGAHMALPIVAMTLREMETDRQPGSEYLTAFPPLPDSLQALLDCPSYSDEIPTEYLSRKEAREFRREEKALEDEQKPGEDLSTQEETKEKTGFFKKIRNFFRKKDK